MTDVTSFIGRGPSRFGFTMRPEKPNSAYAHILVRVAELESINELMAQVNDKLGELALDAEMTIRRSQFTSSGPYKIEARIFRAGSGDVTKSGRTRAADLLGT